LIEKIERATEFPTEKSALCDWCEYKAMCPEWGGKPPAKASDEVPSAEGKEDLGKYPTVGKYLR
jgi:putative RecB family exonuclease